MTTKEALALLESDRSRVRLDAARTLQSSARSEDLPAIRKCLEREKDAWVRRALIRTLRRLQPAGREIRPPGAVDNDDETPGLVEDVWAEATEQVTALLIHEVSPLLIAIASAARDELKEFYPSSRTQSAIERLRGLLDAVSRLGRAAQPPELREFDLTDLVMSVIRDEGLHGDHRVQVGRENPVVVSGDPALVRLALCNGVRNAMEATSAAERSSGPEVVVNWGVTDREAWISTLDNGVGLPEGAVRVFDFGATSKPKSEHFGLGLTISRQAIVSLGGRLNLRPRQVGTAFELYWPQVREVDS